MSNVRKENPMQREKLSGSRTFSNRGTRLSKPYKPGSLILFFRKDGTSANTLLDWTRDYRESSPKDGEFTLSFDLMPANEIFALYEV